MMQIVYMEDGNTGRISRFCKIPGATIDDSGVYYKNSNGDLFNHATYENDPSYPYYEGPVDEYIRHCFDNRDSDEPLLFDSNGDNLLSSDLRGYENTYTYSNGTWKTVGYLEDVAIRIIVDGQFIVYNTNLLMGNYIYETNHNNNTKLPITGGSEGKSRLVSRQNSVYNTVALYGLNNIRISNNIDDMPRGKIGIGDIYNESEDYINDDYAINIVDTRSTCFTPLLQQINSGSIRTTVIRGPYILNAVGKCVAITHAPDLSIYSIINFGDGTLPVYVFTDPTNHDFDSEDDNICTSCWSGGLLHDDINPTARPLWGDSEDNVDPYVARMRDYRATHRYASNGTYTITIESYAIRDATGSDAGTRISHTTHSFNVTVTDVSEQDIIYFKVPKEFDHLYINGVRCPLVGQGNDYNVVGLDVTGYDWMLGKVCAGRRDVIMCKLPLLSTTNYVKYQCQLTISREYYDSNARERVTSNFDPITVDMSYDAVSQLYYVDDLATKMGVSDLGCGYGTVDNNEVEYDYRVGLVITGVDQNNAATTIISKTYSSFPFGKVFAANNVYGSNDISKYYYGWQPYFARSSIQVAEAENDYVRNTTDTLPYVRSSRATAKFMSDYPSLVSLRTVFGNDAVTPLANYFSNTYHETYETSYDPAGGTDALDAIVILTEACIGKTYDLRGAIPWKSFFPGCYCVDAPLNVYN